MLPLIDEIIMPNSTLQTRLMVYSSRFRRAESLTGVGLVLLPVLAPDAAAADGRGDGAAWTEGTAPAISLTRLWLRNPILDSSKSPGT